MIVPSARRRQATVRPMPRKLASQLVAEITWGIGPVGIIAANSHGQLSYTASAPSASSIARSNGTARPAAHAAAVLSPSAPLTVAVSWPYADCLPGGSGAPMASRKPAAAPNRRAARRGCACAAATPATPSKQSAIARLSPMRRSRIKLSLYRARACSSAPCDRAIFPSLLNTTASSWVSSNVFHRAKLSCVSAIARPASPCWSATSPKFCRDAAMP